PAHRPRLARRRRHRRSHRGRVRAAGSGRRGDLGVGWAGSGHRRGLRGHRGAGPLRSAPGGTAAMTVLDTIHGPAGLAELDGPALTALAAEIRQFLVEKVTRTGGHLGPNLGVVELTIALHRVFDSPYDRLLFDTGHQAYVHKILTGRRAGFDQLRQRGGLSGYPNRAESEHDVIENSHASTALSYADGLAKAYALRGER